MKAKRAADFRIQRKNVGLTWSCPVDPTQPIPSKEVILADVTALYGHSQYVVAHELHESGQSHYHAYFKFDGKLELTDPRCFDLYGVHPNIVGSAGPAWANYCRKKGDYISNMDKRNCHAEALAASTVKEAVDIIKRHDPAAYNRFGHALERNLRRHIAPTSTLPSARFQGPYPPGASLPTQIRIAILCSSGIPLALASLRSQCIMPVVYGVSSPTVDI